MQKRIAFAAGIMLFVALFTWILVEYNTTADGYENLRMYSPNGHHFIDTIFMDGKVKWTSREIMFWRVRKRSREFSSVDEFKTAFLRELPHSKATIEVNHPALNLNIKEGRNSHERAEAILALLAENDYENAGPIAD